MKKFFSRLVVFKNRLTRLNDDEPVTKLALAIIIILDIFILNIIFAGLSEHTRQLTDSSDYFPYPCRQVYINKNWSQANKIDKLQYMVLSDYNNWSYRYDSPFSEHKIAKMHPICVTFYNAVKSIADNKELKDLFVKRQDTIKRKKELVKKHDRENEIYDTTLLQNIADKDSAKMTSMADSIKGRASEIDRLNAAVRDLNSKIARNQLVKDFWAVIKLGDEELRKQLVKDLNSFDKRYLVKELFWQMLFLVPLLVIFSAWQIASANKERKIQSLISAHLIVVAVIPIVMKVGHLVIELIPYHFFKDLFDLLERLHIVALWHYGVIFLSVGAALIAVYVIQKKIFNKERLFEKRLMKGVCYSCGKKLPDSSSSSCTFCGAPQIRKCKGCGEDTPIHGKFCSKCGLDQRDEQKGQL